MTNLIMIKKLKQHVSYFFENFIKMRKMYYKDNKKIL